MSKSDQKTTLSSSDEKKEQKKRAKREAKAIKALDEARRVVKRFEEKLEKQQANLLAREMKLERIRATSVVSSAESDLDESSKSADGVQIEKNGVFTFDPAEAAFVEVLIDEIAQDLANADLTANAASEETEQSDSSAEIAAAMVQDTLAEEPSPSADTSDAELVTTIIQDTNEAEIMVVDLQPAATRADEKIEKADTSESLDNEEATLPAISPEPENSIDVEEPATNETSDPTTSVDTKEPDGETEELSSYETSQSTMSVDTEDSSGH